MIDHAVPIRWNLLSSRKIGSTSVAEGMIMVTSVIASRVLRPRNLVSARAYPAGTLVSRVRTREPPE
jgi:hypothetical protein